MFTLLLETLIHVDLSTGTQNFGGDITVFSVAMHTEGLKTSCDDEEQQQRGKKNAEVSVDSAKDFQNFYSG